MAALAEADLGHVRVVVGGIVPDEDERMLLAAGVSRVFHPGSSREDIVATVGRLAHDARQAQAGLPDHPTHPEPGAAPQGAHP
jgi:methylmalonyl-CoA mutase, C-terminal domain